MVISRLFTLISDHTFPSTTNASVAAYASSFIKSASATPERNTTKEVLNCLRVLQRVLPVVFEAQGDSNTFDSELLWKRETETEDAHPITEPQFVIEDEDESDHEGKTVQGISTPAIVKPKTKWLPSLGEKLLTSITDLLFCCGFTLPKTIQVDHHKINYVIWYVIEFKIFVWFITAPKGKRALDRLQTLATTAFSTVTGLKFSAFCSSSFRSRYTPLQVLYLPSHPFSPSMSFKKFLDAMFLQFSARFSIQL